MDEKINYRFKWEHYPGDELIGEQWHLLCGPWTMAVIESPHNNPNFWWCVYNIFPGRPGIYEELFEGDVGQGTRWSRGRQYRNSAGTLLREDGNDIECFKQRVERTTRYHLDQLEIECGQQE
jgi:hypothetical protein